MTRRQLLLLLVVAPALAACGRKGELEPPRKEKDADERRKGS